MTVRFARSLMALPFNPATVFAFLMSAAAAA